MTKVNLVDGDAPEMSTTITNGVTATVTNVTIGEPYTWNEPVETIDVPPVIPPTPPQKKTATPARPPHWLDEWVKHFTAADLAERLEEELKRRGLYSPKDFNRNPMKVVAALQRVLELDATKIINLANLMEDSDNGD